MLIILIEDSDCSDFSCVSLLYLFRTLTCQLYCHLALLSIVTLILPWLFWSPHMHGFIVVYHLTWWVDSLAYILSWSSFEHVVFVTVHLDCHSLYVDMNGISMLCLTICCMTNFLLYDCMAFVRVGTHLSPYLQSSSSRSFLSSWLSLLQVWGLACVCFFDRARV